MAYTIKKEINCQVCGDPTSDVFMRKSGYTLYDCRTCGLKFVYPVPESTDVYGEDYFSGARNGFGYVNYDVDKEPMVPTFKKYLKHIERYGKGKRILDVGAATGFFLEIARRADFDPYGVEISPYAARRAAEKGIPMITGTLSDVPDSWKFNVITMLDVIEHVPSPSTEIERSSALLKEEGILIINTPDIGSFFARLMGSMWHLIVPPEHLFYFNRKNIRILLEKNGFEVLLISTVGKSFTFQYIFKTLYRWQRLSAWKFLSVFFDRTWLGRMAIPINLRDNMFIIARKTGRIIETV